MLKVILLAGTALVALSGAALAADMGDYDYAPLTAGYEGFYAGVNGGYAQGTLSSDDPSVPSLALAGGFVGGQAGYNFVLIDGIVAGLQGDLDWAWESGASGTPQDIGPTFKDATLGDTIKWTGSLTGHVGVTAGGLMAYALAGVAGVGNELTNNGNDGLQGATPIEADLKQNHLGWTAGVGVSAMVGQFAGFVEYRYSDYGKADYTEAVGSSPVRLVDQQVRVGINYHMH